MLKKLLFTFILALQLCTPYAIAMQTATQEETQTVAHHDDACNCGTAHDIPNTAAASDTAPRQPHTCNFSNGHEPCSMCGYLGLIPNRHRIECLVPHTFKCSICGIKQPIALEQYARCAAKGTVGAALTALLIKVSPTTAILTAAGFLLKQL